MRTSWLALFGAALVLLVHGCSVSNEAPDEAASATSGGAGGGAGAGLPCETADLLGAYCTGCHGNPPSGGAPMPMLTYEDLAAESPKGGTYAERAIIRMKDAAAPMPPLPAAAVPPEQIAAFESWVAGGLAPGDCDGVGGGAPSPYDTPEVCTSAKTWTLGDHESPDMHPGMACIKCHTDKNDGPPLYVGGTVYPTAHEPDDCNGYSGLDGTIVEITDATMKVFQIPVRVSGNFFWPTIKGKITMPIQARVVRGDQVRAMADPVPTGDCNTCHTLEGSGMPQAPGRIMAP